MRIITPVLMSALLAAAPLSASPFTFFDGFEDETAGGSILNYNGFANWNATFGTVDLVRSGEFGITCRTGNYCVDLDGSTNDAATFNSRTFSFAAGDDVDISFWLSGNQRGGGQDRLLVGLWFFGPVDLLGFSWLTPSGYSAPSDELGLNGGIGLSSAFDPREPFGNWGARFRAGTAGSFYIRLVHWDSEASIGGGSDNIGVILDDVSVGITPRVAPIPEPATWAMLIAGFGLVGAAMRRRSSALA